MWPLSKALLISDSVAIRVRGNSRPYATLSSSSVSVTAAAPGSQLRPTSIRSMGGAAKPGHPHELEEVADPERLVVVSRYTSSTTRHRGGELPRMPQQSARMNGQAQW